MKPPHSSSNGDEPKGAPKAGDLAGAAGAGGPRSIPAISGPIGVLPGEPTAEVRQWAGKMLTLLFGDRKTPAQSPPAAAPPEEDSNILIGSGAETPLRLDELLARALTKVGYSRVDKLVYRADWSTPEVEHIITFDTYGTPKEFLVGDVGLRNKEADSFAKQCRQRYADPIIRNSGFVPPPWWCYMHCSLSMLAEWKSRSLYTPHHSQVDIERQIVESIQDFVLPYVGAVTTIDSLFKFLSTDTEPMRWTRVGPYFRGAEVAFLGRKLGVPPEKIEAILRSHASEMVNGLGEDGLTPVEYIVRIIQDADTALAGRYL